eukprot:1581476-Prymnesium_polylepis.1
MHWTDEPASASNAASGSSGLPGCCPRKQKRRDIGDSDRLIEAFNRLFLALRRLTECRVPV